MGTDGLMGYNHATAHEQGNVAPQEATAVGSVLSLAPYGPCSPSGRLASSGFSGPQGRSGQFFWFLINKMYWPIRNAGGPGQHLWEQAFILKAGGGGGGMLPLKSSL